MKTQKANGTRFLSALSKRAWQGYCIPQWKSFILRVHHEQICSCWHVGSWAVRNPYWGLGYTQDRRGVETSSDIRASLYRIPFRHKALKHLSWESLPCFMVKIHTLNKLKYSIDKLQLILYSNAAFNSCMKYIPSQSHFMQFLTMLQKNAHGSTCGQSHFG